MAATSPNPYRDPRPWYEVTIGDRLIKAILIAVDGFKIEDEWKADKPTGKNGAEQVFKGTKPAGPFKCTFEAPDEESFDDLGDIYEQLAPVPGLAGGPAATKAPTGYTSGIGQPSSGSSGSSATSGFASGGTVASSGSTSSGKSKSKDPDPGPRPPTLTIKNAFFEWLGVVAVSRKSISAPKPAAGNSWTMEIEFVGQKPPTPAGVGKAGPPKPGSQWVSAGSPQASADAEKKKADSDANGV